MCRHISSSARASLTAPVRSPALGSVGTGLRRGLLCLRSSVPGRVPNSSTSGGTAASQARGPWAAEGHALVLFGMFAVLDPTEGAEGALAVTQ